jgi:hypothetical protein
MKEGGVEQQVTCMEETRNVYGILFSKPTKQKQVFGWLGTRGRVMLKCIVNK